MNRALILVDGTYKWINAAFIGHIGAEQIGVVYAAGAKKGEKGYTEVFTISGSVVFTGYGQGARTPWTYKKLLSPEEKSMVLHATAATQKEIEEARRVAC